jgi:hypothetical protein
MSNASHHHTTPFRRPSQGMTHEVQHDPADMGVEFGLEMRLTPPESPTASDAGQRRSLSAPSRDE